MTYRDYFGFIEEPFGAMPDPNFLFMSPSHVEAIAHIMYGMNQNRGFIMLAGEAGSGKTTIIRHILQNLGPGFRTAMILNPSVDALDLLRCINKEFGLSVKKNTTYMSIMDSLNSFLLECHTVGGKALLVIDDAQKLSPECLEFVRLLSNLETNTSKLLQVLLVGQTELLRIVRQERLRQLNQRIAVRYYLGPMSERETSGYLNHRLHIAGSLSLAFPSGGVRLIYRYSGGIPRLINLAADRSLSETFAEGTTSIKTATIRRAINDLKSLNLQRTLLRPNLLQRIASLFH